MATTEIYEKIAEIFEFPGSQKLVEYLKVLFKPDEGEFLLEFVKPTTRAEAAKRLNMEEAALTARLDDFQEAG